VNCIIQTKDGGFVLTGESTSTGEHLWVFKIDQDGNKIWDKTYQSGINGKSIVQTTDGGYAVIAESWILRLDNAGNQVWNKTFSDLKLLDAKSMIQTSDDGFAIAGTSNIDSSQVAWIAKLDKNGTKEWNEYFRKSGADSINAIIQLSAHEYVFVGQTHTDSDDGWLVKIAVQGNNLAGINRVNSDTTGIPKAVWDKTYGGLPGYEDIEPSFNANIVIQTSDGGYALAGHSELTNVWVMKVDKIGHKKWALEFNNAQSLTDVMRTAILLIQTKDNGFVIGGSKRVADTFNYDYWITKINQNGIIEWEKTYERNNRNEILLISQTPNNGFIMAGHSYASHDSHEYYILKLTSKGLKEWDQHIIKENFIPTSLSLTKAGEFIIAGRIEPQVWKGRERVAVNMADLPDDYVISKLDKNGNKMWEKNYPAYLNDAKSKVICTPSQIIHIANGGFALLRYIQPIGSDKKFPALMKASSDGSKEWEYSLETFGNVESLSSTSDGGFILAGLRSVANSRGTIGWVVKLDKNGNKEWDESYRKNGRNVISSIVQTSDGGFALAGQTNSRAWLIKLDPINK
jgi:hypothetical protein